MRAKILSLILLIALVVTGVALLTVPAYAPPAGIDRFNYTWTQHECQNGGCQGADLYTVDDWSLAPTCGACSTPMTSVSTGLDYSAISAGESLLWLEMVVK